MAEGQAGAPSGGEGQTAQTSQAEAPAQTTQGQEAQTVEGQPQTDKGEQKETEGEKPTHKYQERLTDYFPDRTFESEDDYESAFEEYLTDHEEYRKRGDEANGQLKDFLEANPKAANAIRESMKNGVPFNVALAKHFSPEDFTVEEGDETYSDYEKNVRERNEQLAKQRAWQTEYNKNVEESNKVIEQFGKENDMKDDDIKSVLSQFDQMLGELQQGKVTPDSLNRILKAVQYEKAVQDAAEEAELKTKNQKIKAEMSKEEPKGDGLPAPQKGGDTKDEKKKPSRIDEIFESSQKRDVWGSARNK